MKHVIKLATCKDVLFLLLITYAIIISIVHVRVAFYIPGLCYDLKQEILETIRGELNDNKTNAINP